MDTAWQVIAVLAAPIFGLVGVYVGGRLQAKKDDERWRREVEREQDRWRREDDRRWLNEQYRMYSNLMAAMTEALQAMNLSYEMHPSVSWARIDEEEAKRLVVAASKAVAAARPVLDAAALLAHPGIYEIAWRAWIAMQTTALAHRADDAAGLTRYLRDARREYDNLRQRIRHELGVERILPDTGDDDGSPGGTPP